MAKPLLQILFILPLLWACWLLMKLPHTSNRITFPGWPNCDFV